MNSNRSIRRSDSPWPSDRVLRQRGGASRHLPATSPRRRCSVGIALVAVIATTVTMITTWSTPVGAASATSTAIGSDAPTAEAATAAALTEALAELGLDADCDEDGTCMIADLDPAAPSGSTTRIAGGDSNVDDMPGAAVAAPARAVGPIAPETAAAVSAATGGAEYRLSNLLPAAVSDVSIDVGPDDRAVIGYRRSHDGSVWAARCLDHDCTAANHQQVVPGFTADAAMVTGDSGSPTFAVVGFADTDGTLFVVACDDASCGSSTTTELALDASEVDIALDAARNPVLAVQAGSQVSVVACSDPACVAPPTITPIGSGFIPSVAIGADGNPVLSFARFDGFPHLSLAVAVCADPTCTSATVSTVWGHPFQRADYSDVAIGADGNPVIVFDAPHTLGGDDLLVVLTCADPSCSSTTEARPYLGRLVIGKFGMPSIAIGDLGDPIVAFTSAHGSETRLRTIACDDPACTTSQVFFQTTQSPPHAITVRPDGNPILAIGQDSLRALSCSTFRCDPPVLVDVTDLVETQELEGAEIVIGFQRSGRIEDEVIIPLTFVPGSASADDIDLLALPNSVIIPSGESSAEIRIPVVDDAEFEGRESFTIELGEAAAVHLPSRTVIAQIDDDADIPPAQLVVSSGEAELFEFDTDGDGVTDAIELLVPVDASVGLQLEVPFGSPSEVVYHVTDVELEATPGDDYEPISLDLGIAPGETRSIEFFLHTTQPADFGSGFRRSFFLNVTDSSDALVSSLQVRIDNPLDPPVRIQRPANVPPEEPVTIQTTEGTGQSVTHELILHKDEFLGTDSNVVEIQALALDPDLQARVETDVELSATTFTFTPEQPTHHLQVTIAGNTIEDDSYSFEVLVTNEYRLGFLGNADDTATFNVIDDDGIQSDADEVRSGIFDWFFKLIEWIRGFFVGQSDVEEAGLPGYETPVVPVEVLNLAQEVESISPPSLDFGADTLEEAVADFEAAGCPVDFAAGGAGGATAADGDDVLQVRCPTTIADIAEAAGSTVGDLNPLTPDLLQDLGTSLGFDPTIDWLGDIDVELIIGFDAGGLYVLGSSGMDLHVAGDGTLTGDGTLLGVPGAVFAGTAGADLTISLDMSLDPDERIRITSVDDLIPQQLVPVAQGTASMNVAAELPHTSLSWDGTWNVGNDDTGATTVTTLQDVTIVQELLGFTSPTGTTPTVELQGTYGERDGVTGWYVSGTTQAEDGLQLGGFRVTSLEGNGFVNATTVDLEITATIEIGSGAEAVTVDVVLVITDGDWTATANAVADTFTLGPVTLVDSTLDIDAAYTSDPETFGFQVLFTAASATIDDAAGDQVAELTGITGELSGTERLTLSADSVSTSVGNALDFALTDVSLSVPATDGVLFSVADAVATAPGLGDLQVTVTDLQVHDDGRFSATSASVTQPSGIARSIGLAGLIPVDITALTLDFTNVDPVTGEVVDLSEFTIAVEGTVDLSGFADLPFDPVVQLGADTITPASPPEDRVISFSAFVESLDPLVISPLDLGPIGLGLENLEVGSTTLSVVVTADGYVDGVLQPGFSGSAEITGGFGTITGEVTADISGLLVDGPTGPEVDATARVGFGAAIGTGVSIDDLFATLELHLGVDDGTPFLVADLVEVEVGSVSIDFGTFADVRLTNATVDLTPDDAGGTSPVVFSVGGSLAEPGTGASILFDEGVGVFAGWGGRVGGFGINTDFEPVLLEGFFAEVTMPDDELFGLPDFLPFHIDEVGFSLPQALAPGDVLTDALNGLQISVSGGLRGTTEFPVSASVQDLVVDLGLLADYDPSMGFDVATFPIQNLSGVRLAIEPELDLGVAKVSGELTFGVVDITTETGVEEVLYLRAAGNLSTPVFEAGADVVLSEYGPVLIRITSPAGLPLGPTGLILKSVTGAAAFGDVALPTPDPGEPEQLLNVIVDLPTDANLDADGIAAAIAPAVAAGTPTWTQGFAVALEGELEHIAAPGLFTGTVTLATSVMPGAAPQLVGVGEIEVFGLPLGDGVEATGSLGVAGLLLDFTDPLAPQIDFAFRSPTPGSPLATIMPTQTTVAAQLNTDGIATGVAAGIAAFVDTFTGTALDGLAAHLEADRVSPLSKLVLDADGNGDVDDIEGAVVITGAVLGARLTAIVSGDDGAASVDDLIAALGAYAATLTPEEATALFGGFLETVAAASEAALRAAADEFDPSFVLRGTVQPVLFGIPIGGPDESIEIRIDTTSFSFELTTSIVEALKSGGGVADVAASIAAVGVTDELTFEVQFPLAGQTDVVFDGGRMETLGADDPDWSVGISGSVSQFGIGAQVSGFLVGAGNQTFLDQEIELRLEPGTTPPDPDKIQLIRQEDYDTLLEHGGLLIDARLEVPRLLTDPVDLIGDLEVPDTPEGFLELFQDSPQLLTEFDTPVRATLLLPGLGGVIDGTQTAGEWASGISFTGVLEGTRATPESDPVAKLLSIPIGEGRVIIDSTGIEVTANIPLLGLDAEFALGMEERPNPDPTGDPFLVPRGFVSLQFDSANVDTALEGLGLPPVFSSVGAGLQAGFRAYTPGFDPDSDDPLERGGGVELTAALSIDGIVDNVEVRAAIFNLTGEFGPDFELSGVVEDVHVVEFAGVRIEQVSLTVAKNGADITVDLLGQATIFDQQVTIAGDLNVFDLTGSLRFDVDPGSLPDAGDFALQDLAFLIDLVRDTNDDLVGTVAASGTVQIPDWLTGTGEPRDAGVAGCFDTQGDLELRVDLGTLHLVGGGTATTSDDLIITGTGAPFTLDPAAPCTLPPDAIAISDDGVRLVVRVDNNVGTVFVDGAVRVGGPTTAPVFEVTGQLSTDGTGELTAAVNTEALNLPVDVGARVTLRLDGPDGFELTVEGRITLFADSPNELVLAEATLRIGFSNGVFTIELPEPGIQINLGFASFGVHGFVSVGLGSDVPPEFSITGTFSTEGAVPNPFGGDLVAWNGSIEVTISSAAGISGSFAGSVTVLGFTAEADAFMSSAGVVRGSARADLNGDGSFAGFKICVLGCIEIAESASFEFDLGAGETPDTQAPTMAQPKDVRVATSETSPTVPVEFLPPVANDDLSGRIIAVCDPGPRSEFPVKATTKVTCTASDAAGNKVTRTFNVTVDRFEIPEATAFKIAQEAEIEQDGLDDGTVSRLILRSTPRELSEVTVGSDGVARHSFTIPADVEPGDHHLEIHGIAGGDPVLTVIPVVLGEGGAILSVEGIGAGSSVLKSVVPGRVFESRRGPADTTVDGLFEGVGRRAAGSVTQVTVTGRAGVPLDASAVVLNVTAVDPGGRGFLTVFPCGGPLPHASSVNYRPGEVAPNAVLAKVGVGGKVCVFTLAATDLIIDVNGYVPGGGSPLPVVPGRVFESRRGPADTTVDGLFEGVGRRAAGSVTQVTVTGRAGVPLDASAVVLNVTAVDPGGRGFLTVFPCGGPLPHASSVNYRPGEVAPNAVLAKVGVGGKVCVFTLAATDLIIDVNGYVPGGGSPLPVVPGRVFESRRGPADTTVDGLFEGVGRRAAGSVTQVTVTGRAGVPLDASAVVLNVTAVDPGGRGFLTVFPCGEPLPHASSVNYRPGEVAPNAVLAKVGVGGKVCVFTLAATDLIIDVNGYVGAT